MGSIKEENEYKKCPKANVFKLWLAFVLGMSSMVIAVAIFDYISLDRKFKLLPILSAREGDVEEAGSDIGYGDPSESASSQTHESKKVSYQMRMKPLLGIEVMEILDSGQSKKVFITRIVKGSPADEAGLIRGDEIVKFDRREIEDITKLQELISKRSPEDRIKIEILRNGKRESLYIKLGSLILGDQIWNAKNLVQANFEEELSYSACSRMQDETSDWGISVSPWTEQLSRKYGLESDGRGIIVEKVISGSQASKAGLMAGDLIRAVNQNPTPHLESFFDAMQNKGRVLLDVFRQGESIYLVIPEEDEKPLCKRLKEDE